MPRFKFFEMTDEEYYDFLSMYEPLINDMISYTLEPPSHSFRYNGGLFGFYEVDRMTFGNFTTGVDSYDPELYDYSQQEVMYLDLFTSPNTALDVTGAFNVLDGDLEFGNVAQIEALKILNTYNLLHNIDSDLYNWRYFLNLSDYLVGIGIDLEIENLMIEDNELENLKFKNIEISNE